MSSLNHLQQAERSDEDESELEKNAWMATSSNVFRIKCRDFDIMNVSLLVFVHSRKLVF